MLAFQFLVEGNWAHFKRPETNNNPLTHDFITKTALIGLIGAVLGKDRGEMRNLFAELSEDLLYGVRVVNPVKKESWGFIMRRLRVDSGKENRARPPKQMELLRNPKFIISLALTNKRSKALFQQIIEAIKNRWAHYTPVLGLHNCPASLAFMSEGAFSDKQDGDFKAECVVSRKHRPVDITSQFLIGFDRIPTFQNTNWWNVPDRYVEVIYPSEGRHILVRGDFYEYANGERWWLM